MKPVVEDKPLNTFRSAVSTPVQETVTVGSVPVDTEAENNAVARKPDGIYASCSGVYCAYVFQSAPYTYLEEDEVRTQALQIEEGGVLRSTVGDTVSALESSAFNFRTGGRVEQVYFETTHTQPPEDALESSAFNFRTGGRVEQVYFELIHTQPPEDALEASAFNFRTGGRVEQVYFEIIHTQPPEDAIGVLGLNFRTGGRVYEDQTGQ